MREQDYYPEGSYNDPSAPWNQSEQEPKEWDCNVMVSLVKTMAVSTTNYTEYPPEPEPDDEGGYVMVPGGTDTDNVDWKEEYEGQGITPDKAMEMAADYLERWLEGERPSKGETKRIKEAIEELRGWSIEDLDVEQA